MAEPSARREEGAGRRPDRPPAGGRVGWLFAGGILVLALGTGPAPAPAQESDGGTVPALQEGSYSTPTDSGSRAEDLRLLAADSLGLAAQEPFVYPLGGRRNPFQSPADRGRAGPSFASLSLTGIIYAPASGSVAVVVDRASGRRYRLRVGDRIGDARLVEVGPDRAVFRVTTYGTARRAVLRLRDSQERELQ